MHEVVIKNLASAEAAVRRGRLSVRQGRKLVESDDLL